MATSSVSSSLQKLTAKAESIVSTALGPDPKVGTLEPKKLSGITTELKALISGVDEMTDPRRVSEAVSHGIFRVATAEQSIQILASLRGMDFQKLLANVDTAIGLVTAGPPRAAKIPLTNPIKLDPSGAIQLVLGDISKIASDVSVVPNWAEANPQGGIAACWVKEAKNANSSSGGALLPLNEAKSFLQAALSYEIGRSDELNGAYDRGSVQVAPTGLSSRGAGPAYLVHTACVPPKELRWDRYPPDSAEYEKHQIDRKAFVDEMLRKTLFRTIKALAKDPELAPSADNPVRITLPAISTGPDGALSFAECGEVMGRVLREFHTKHPGFEFVIAVRDKKTGGFEKDKKAFEAAFKGIAKSDAKVRYPTAAEMLDRLIGPYAEPQAAGVKVTESYLTSKLAAWKDSFLDQAKSAGEALRDRMVGRTFFTTRAGADAFNQISRFLEMPALREGLGLSKKPGPLTMDDVKVLLSDSSIRTDVIDELKAKLPAEGFAGNDKMGDIVGAALAKVLQERRFGYFDELQTKFLAEMKPLQEESDAIEKKIADKAKLAADQVEKLRRQVLQAMARGDEAEAEAAKFKKELKSLIGDKANLQTEVDQLTGLLEKQTKVAKTRNNSVEARQTQSYYSTESRTSYGGG